MNECTCPACGNVFESESGMKIHYGHVHDGSLATEETTCTNCGDMFEYKVADKNGVFCSDCINNQSYPNELYYEHNILDNEGKNNPMFGKERSKEVRETLRKTFTGTTHSEETKKKMRRRLEGVTGPDHPAWKGGFEEEIPYGKNWEPQRKKALQRDKGRCTVCGKTRKESRKQHGKDLTVHHKIPRAFFFYHPFKTVEEDANQLNNLEVVCPSHHSKHDASVWHK